MKNYLLVNPPNSELLKDEMRHYEGCQEGIPKYMQPYGRGLKPETIIKIDLYKCGSQVFWPVEGPAGKRKADLPDREPSLEQSTKSRLNAAWKIGNSNTEWFAMTTFTYPTELGLSMKYSDIERHRNRILANVRKNYPGQHRAWILEFTKKGVPHFHFFWGLGPLSECLAGEKTKWVRRKNAIGDKVKTEIARGQVDKNLVRWWSKGADDNSIEFEKFQNGGITELLRCPEAAAKYVAKEAAKREQKKAPFHVSAWWGCGPNEIKPIMEETIELRVDEYLNRFGPVMLSKLFERADTFNLPADSGKLSDSGSLNGEFAFEYLVK